MNKFLPARLISFLLLIALGATVSGADISDPIPLWPKGAPDDKGVVGKESDTTTSSGRLVGGRHVIRLGNVSEPTITIYQPPKDKDTGAAIVVCPGGGYSILALDLEGTEVCQWLNSIGVTGVLLKYRVPVRRGDDKHILPLQDAQRALGLVRFHAQEWNIDPKRIGILGFSAGGHLTATLCNHDSSREYAPVDGADQVSCRPDFSLLIYPAYLVLKDSKTTLDPNLKITTNTPPAFLIQAEDDTVGVENCLEYYLALKKVHVPAEMHLYGEGGHGYGLRPSGQAVNTWPQRAEEWLRGAGLLNGRGH